MSPLHKTPAKKTHYKPKQPAHRPASVAASMRAKSLAKTGSVLRRV